MAESVNTQGVSEETPKWRIVGPGLVAAATGVGAGDLVATLLAGSLYGYVLLWAAVLGCIFKIVLVEGTGRWYLATGKTIFQGWRSLGIWTSWYFGIYVILWGFVYGATAMTSSALPLATLFPGIPLNVFAVISGVVGLALVWFGKYGGFEKIMTVMVGILFIAVVGSAVLAVPNLGGIISGLVPRLPEGSLFYVLGIAGGVGGTITLAAYGYWLKEKGWHTPQWMKVMRIDNSVAYIVTGILAISMLIVGAELLFAANIAMSEGDDGLIDLAGVLADRYGETWSIIFLIGFWAASFSSLLGVWNGVSLMFADFVVNYRKHPKDLSADKAPGSGSKQARVYMLWLTFPPMLLLLLGEPFALIVAYGVLGALFMPFLAITLLWLLNSKRVPQQWRNKALSNVLLSVVALVFIVLGFQELYNQVAPFFGG